MSRERDWVLQQFADVVDSTSAPLRRVNRDDSRILEGAVRDARAELQDANYVGATHVDTTRDPIGTEYDARREVVVGVRVTGLHHSEYGHIDPSGEDGVPFSGPGGLVEQCTDAVLAERTFPDAGASGVSYTHLELQNEANTSQQYSDFYRADFDVVFDGYEDLP